MSAVTVTAPARRRPAGIRYEAMVGTPTLIRLALRRDRIKLPAWTVGLVAFWLYYATAIPAIYETPEDLQAAAGLVAGPLGRLLTGPGYGFDALTVERFVIGGYGFYILVLVAVMSILLVTRHTRVEEQTGRAELVRADVVGRHAPLAASMAVAVLANLLVAAAVATAMLATGFAAGPTVLFAAGLGLVGLAFAGLTALCVQLSEYSKAAAGLAGIGLGAAFVIRAGGDMIAEHGSALSWLSPLGWAQQTAPFVLDRWWPLALPLAFAVATAAAGFLLSTRRDVGASLVPARPGPAGAASWLDSPLALATRLHRASILGWTAALVATGVLYGAFADAVLTAFDDMPETVVEVMGGRGDLLAGYLGFIALFMGLIAGILAILAVQAVRTEETSGRGEPVLATPVGRWEWLGTHLAVVAVTVLVVLGLAGLATGLAAAVVTGDPALVGDVGAAHLAQVPAVLVVLAVAGLLYGIAPRLTGLAWAVLGYAMFAGFFGRVMDLPAWAYDLSPFEHVGAVPAEPLALTSVLTLVAVAAVLALLGLLAFRRRDIVVG